MKERFYLLRKTLKLTQKEMAERLNKTYIMVQNYEKGRSNISDGILLKLNELFNVNIDWLRSGNGSMFLPKPDTVPAPVSVKKTKKDECVPVKYYPEVRASAGGGSFVQDETAEDYWLDIQAVKNRRMAAVITVIGDSMYPLLWDKDKILIDTDVSGLRHLTRGMVYVIGASDGLLIKRFKKREGTKAIFSSDNKAYGDIKVDLSDGTERIVGILRSIVHRVIQPYPEEDENDGKAE